MGGFWIRLVAVASMWALILHRGVDCQTVETTTRATTTTVASTTVATTTTTTQTPTTTQPPTPIVPNTDLANCLCDLIDGACNVDCCCDPDCSSSDRLAFSQCVDQSIPVNTQSCIQSSMVFKNNTPYEVNSTTPGLFCIYDNNNQEASYYKVPTLISTDTAFEQSVSRYGSYSFESVATNGTTRNNSYYKSGDPIYAVYETLAFDFLRLPLKSTSSSCVFSPVPYLYGQTASCTSVGMGELSSFCQPFSVIDAHMYFENIKVVSTPEAFPSSGDNLNSTDPSFYNSSFLIPVTVDSTLWCLDETGYNYTCGFTTPPLPVFTSSGVCQNAVKRVTYMIEYDGTKGITAVKASFTFQNISNANLPYSQSFQTNFFKEGENLTFRLSGNPGYLEGEPVMAGNLSTNATLDRVAIELDSDRNNWMTILSSSVDGACSKTSRTPVLFKHELRSGCFVSFTLRNMSDLCNQTAHEVLGYLRGPDPRSHVASFGNTPVTSVGDWVKIIDNPPTLSAYSSSPGECSNFITGMNVQVIYANVGAINNPQPQIIGVKYDYVIQPVVRFQCVGPYCNPSTVDRPQRFEIASSVSFIDASDPAVGAYGAIPQATARLPEDFFYPLG